MVGLQWSDVLAEGNSFGMGVGQPAFATATRNGAASESGVWAWEWWYQWQVTDAISVTPAIFVLNNPGEWGWGQSIRCPDQNQLPVLSQANPCPNGLRQRVPSVITAKPCPTP